MTINNPALPHIMNIPAEFDAIRPYEPEEVQQVLHELIEDRQFNLVLKGFAPWIPKAVRKALLKLACKGIDSPLAFQKRFMKPAMDFLLWKCTTGSSFSGHPLPSREGRYTFISNHRDIVLDSAILDVKLFNSGYPTTVEIAIGDNLLIYPWIKKLVRLNKAFTVRRGLSARELLQSSTLMSKYMHFAVNEKQENIWIAQREGRAKDSNDRTQESVLKMLTLGGEGSPLEQLKHMHIVPLTISYEYDPCDYLKAKEFQQKRDNPTFKKSKQDDLDNMKIGIWGQKGHVHYECAPCISQWLDELQDLPKNEFYTEVARRIDKAIHGGYRLYPGNYVAAHLLKGGYEDKFTEKDAQRFQRYVDSRIALIDLPNKDVPFLKNCILTMYANPVFNYEEAMQ